MNCAGCNGLPRPNTHIAFPGLHAMDYAAFAGSLTGGGRRYGFREIERTGGGPLPTSAYKYPAWWSNSGTHPLMKRVLEAGYVSKDLDLKNHKISFCRDRAKAQNALGARRGQNLGVRGTSRDDTDSEKRFVGERNRLLANLKPDFVTCRGGAHFEHVVEEFAGQIAGGITEIYNEASVQYELAIFLRERLPDYRIQLERNVSYFGLNKRRFEKREMDMVLFNASKTKRFAVEIKFPANGEYPVQMFRCCQDVRFLEQLKEAGFTGGFFLLITPLSNFWRNGGAAGTIYERFRKERELYGEIKNRIGGSKEKVCLKGRHRIGWITIKGSLRYCLIRV